MREGPIGACVFTSDSATRFIQELLGNGDAWELQELGEVAKVSAYLPSSKKVLEKLPGYAAM